MVAGVFEEVDSPARRMERKSSDGRRVLLQGMRGGDTEGKGWSVSWAPDVTIGEMRILLCEGDYVNDILNNILTVLLFLVLGTGCVILYACIIAVLVIPVVYAVACIWDVVSKRVLSALRKCENVSSTPEGFLCSKCGWGDYSEPTHMLTRAKYTDTDKGPNYCPNCGAMVVGI